MHQSIATIDAPEFINLQQLDINPLMSSCEVKVLYVGENRNRSYITKEVATEMSKTLRGAPIVGYYKQDKEDFGDHGHRMIFDDEGVKFECLTVPYGFIAPDSKVWFQKFEEEDGFGNKVVKEYLMANGYLWTGQFEECKQVLEEGRPQSMELDEASLNGHWAENSKNGLEFFIINDAIFSKICILGNDVEPCFEGASVTAPQVSSKFSLDDKFTATLFTMMQDLQSVLKGGTTMDLENKNLEKQETSTPEVSTEAALDTPVETPAEDTPVTPEDFAPANPESDFKKSEEDDKKEEENKDNAESESSEDKTEDKTEDKKDEDKDKEEDKKKYSLLEENFNELQTKFNDLQKQYDELVAFKAQIEDAKKDELIAQFYMLSDEDKKDVIENKVNYSLDEIESKLSVICVRKKVNFDLEDSDKNNNNMGALTYQLEDNAPIEPDWVKAVKENS